MLTILAAIQYIYTWLLNAKIKTVFWDENFLFINKEYDLKINSNDKREVTVQTQLKQKYPFLANEKLVHEFYFVHRLDYATSGLMCIPLNINSCRAVAEAFKNHMSKKYYIAIVRGFVSTEFIDLDLPIGEDASSTENQKMCTTFNENCRSPRKANTWFLVLEYGMCYNYPATKILIRPITGRRHQIRVHCSYLGHCIVGDYTYSNRRDVDPHRMFLHSLRLAIPNSIQNLDVKTKDPFKILEWNSFRVINKMNSEAFDKIDKLGYSYHNSKGVISKKEGI